MSDKHPVFDRYPAVAGKFYPAERAVLQQELNAFFATEEPKQYKNVRAIISPHAGYVFSGKIAASAFNQIDNKEYSRVFIIASSHLAHFKGASVYCDGDFIIPTGKELVDTAFGKELVESFPELFSDDKSAHWNEHSIEVQLPFLHHVLKYKYKIVPIILGTSSPEVCKQIASVLKPYLTGENLFIISTDFSHYPDYENAKSVDSTTALAIVSNNPDHLLLTLAENKQKHFPHLSTSLCGWTSVLTLLYMTANDDNYQYKGIKYSNSGDAENFGEQDRVVGYWAMAVMEKGYNKTAFILSKNDKQRLLQEARKTIENLFVKVLQPETDTHSCSSELKAKCGAFVTIHNHSKLRGCYGRLASDKPLIQTVREMAVWAAERDYRFNPVTEEELSEIDIEISVLSPLHKIDDISEILLGVHGIYIVKGQNSGVFLPQVATETGWNLENYLGHCARDKAGIGWEGWKSANIFIFTATVLGEKA